MAATKTIVKGMVNKDLKMDGKTVLITGANTGMGLAKSIDMAKRGARVIMTSRNMERGNEARDTVVKESGCKPDDVVVKQLDLSSFESIRQFAADINENESRLDVLINNAGVMMCPNLKTKDGYEMQFGVNHLGHFLLTNLLLDLIKKSAPSRIVTYSSSMHHKRFGAEIFWNDLNSEKDYSPSKAYSQSKLMNVMFSRELSKRLEGTGVTTYSVDPGAVKTDLQRHVGTASVTFRDKVLSAVTYVTRPFWNSPEKGAQTGIYCAVAPELEKETGKFYESCKVGSENEDSKNDDYTKRLWDLSEEYTGLKEASGQQKPDDEAQKPDAGTQSASEGQAETEMQKSTEPTGDEKPAEGSQQEESTKSTGPTVDEKPAEGSQQEESAKSPEPTVDEKPADGSQQEESTSEEQKES